jgi:hypothetical protein
MSRTPTEGPQNRLMSERGDRFNLLRGSTRSRASPRTPIGVPSLSRRPDHVPDVPLPRVLLSCEKGVAPSVHDVDCTSLQRGPAHNGAPPRSNDLTALDAFAIREQPISYCKAICAVLVSRTTSIRSVGCSYAASTMICVTTSLDQLVGAALGVQAGFEKLSDAITKAGLRKATKTPSNMILEARA